MKRFTTEAIIIHCTATLAHQDFRRTDIDAMHKRRGFKSIGYHFLIALDGTIEAGRALDLVGAHVKGFNNRTVGVAYVGGLRSHDAKPVDTRTLPQIASMLKLCKELSAKYPTAVILGHRDLSPDLDKDGVVEPNEWMKMCPCFDAGQWARNNDLRGGFLRKGAFWLLVPPAPFTISASGKPWPVEPSAPIPAPEPAKPLPPRAQTWGEWLNSFFR